MSHFSAIVKIPKEFEYDTVSDVVESGVHWRSNFQTVGQNQLFLENKVAINFDFKNKSGHLDYLLQSYGPKQVIKNKSSP